MFNELTEGEKSRQVPAILLLDPSQQQWAARADTSPHRIVLPLPISMKRLLAAVDKLLLAAESSLG